MKLVKLEIYDGSETRQAYVNAKHVMSVLQQSTEQSTEQSPEVTLMTMVDGSIIRAKGPMKTVVLTIESGLG